MMNFIPQLWAQAIERNLRNRLALDLDYNHWHTWHIRRNNLIQRLKLRRSRRKPHYTWFGPLYPLHGEAIKIPAFEVK